MTPIKSVFLIGLSEIKHINHAIEWASHQIGDYLIFKSDVSNFAIKTLIKLWSLFHFLQVPKHNVGVCGTSQNMLSFVDTIKFAGYFLEDVHILPITSVKQFDKVVMSSCD